ncbi:MAG: hypothetical protein FD138_4336 [Planctomycetota bacterium]|nr:MAG: hypothetical protein FD138_4336 [Planctomycetota bacterium]
MNLPFNIESALQGLSKVRLPGGVVGKVTLAVIAVSFAMAAIAWSFQSVWLSAATLGCVFLLAFTMLWRLINFADRHPQAALLEGAEFLVHEQIVLGTKSNPILQIDPSDRMQPEVVEGPAADPRIALSPDTESASLELDNDQEREWQRSITSTLPLSLASPYSRSLRSSTLRWIGTSTVRTVGSSRQRPMLESGKQD